jgi:hypothetical protein
VDPLNRRSLFGAGVGAALGLGATTASAGARPFDPALVGHWMTLLGLLDQHRAAFGPYGVFATVRHQLGLIAEHRRSAHGDLRADLLCVEARWSGLASWLGHDAGNARVGDHWAVRSMRFAKEAGYRDMIAWVLMRQSLMHQSPPHGEPDPHRAVTFAQAARRTPGVTDGVRAICALREAQAHALAGDAASCERSLADAHGLLDGLGTGEDAGRQDLGGFGVTRPCVLAAEARCWLRLRPSKAIGMLDVALDLWPREHVHGRCLHQLRLALSCAAAQEPERAAAEGVKALDVAHGIRSAVIMRELKRLDGRLAGFDGPAVAEFREALATV